MSDLIGETIGRYTIEKELGRGGMAVVYLAHDASLDIDVAIKFLRKERLALEFVEKAQKRFKSEAQETARLVHPNIVPVIDYGDHDGAPFLVMRFIEGERTLKSILGKPIPWKKGVKYILPIAEALEYAHTRNQIVHRDVKPTNILLNQDDTPMLTDFGIARVIKKAETMDGLTSVGVAIGTPEYMAPEQWEGGQVDARADIYALGVVFYEMITGRPPFKGKSTSETMVQVLRDPLPSPRKIIHDLPKNVEQVLLKALARKPEERYQSMKQFISSLEELINGGTQKRTRKMIGGLLTLVIIGGALLGLYYASQQGWVKLPSMPSLPPVIEVSPTLTVIPTSTNVPPNPTVPLPTATVVYQVVDSMVSDADDMPMVYVPEGEFLMGTSNSLGYVEEHPQHTVYLDSYWIDQTEVTNSMYSLCISAGVCHVPASRSSFTIQNYFNEPNYANYPVLAVTWEQAATYCEWVNRRLPTEAEWEKAARGITGIKYPWGDEFDCLKGNFDTEEKADLYTVAAGNKICDKYDDTSPVGTYPEGVSPFGALDMSGNVYEWVADWYGSYTSGYVKNPPGPETGTERVLRGGSWNSDSEDVRAAARIHFDPLYTTSDFGFRCAMDGE